MRHLAEAGDPRPEQTVRQNPVDGGLNELVHRGWLVVGPSAAVLYRSIDARHPTILLDEADRFFEKRAEDMADVLQLINAGHVNGAVVPRVVGAGMALKDFPASVPWPSPGSVPPGPTP